MKRNFLIFSLLSLVLASCQTEDAGNGLIVDSDRISFVTYIPGVSSRSNYDVSKEFLRSGISISAFCPENNAEANGLLKPHCEDAIVSQDVDGIFRGDGCRWPGNRDPKDGHLRFFAFHPSIAQMRDSVGDVRKECFIYSNGTKKDASGITYDYRLTKFRVAPDISRQVDFVTAIGEGNKTDNLYSGVKLIFEHQLCGVELGVWGASTLYDVEIAGVRVGGIVTEADFSLSTVIANRAEDENTIGEWFITDKSKRGHVDFVFAPGDKVVMINANEHNTKDKVSSIMGGAGKALLIPQTQGKWDYKKDRDNTGNGKGMYFSVLIRMYEREGDHHLIYPSTDPQSRDHLVYLLVRTSDGMVMKRLSRSQFESESYVAPDGQEKRAYGWAAVPANVEWKPGFLYSYVLDYSHGVGVHDPADGNPGTTIVDWGGVEVTTTTGEWGNGQVIKIGGGKNNWGANSNNTAPDGTVWWK